MAVGVLGLVLDRDLGGAKAPLLDLLGHQPAAGQPQRADRLVELLQGHAGIHQGAEGHVAADPAGTVEIGNSHASILG